MSELTRLRQGLAAVMCGTWVMPPVPKGIHAEITHLERMLGGGDGSARPSRDRMHEAVSHFWQYGRFSNLGEARLTCFGAIERFSNLRPPLIEHDSAFPRVLDEVDKYSLEPRPFRRCYRGLVHCYFSYDPAASSVPRAGVKNWEQLQQYLDERYEAVRVNGYEPNWVNALAENRHLLTKEPARPYAAAALRGDTEDFARVCRDIEIAETSWLVKRLVLAQVEFAAGRSDNEFKRYVSPLLGVLEEHSILKHEGLAQLVNRYADSSIKEEHKPLRDSTLALWGNPLLQSNLPKWGRVSEPARRMIANWLKLDLIQQFFSVLAEDRSTDQKRVRFWEKYHEQMDGMYFALGSTARWSRSADIRRLRERMGDLELSLVQGGVSANNAFVMLIGGYAIVEFGVKGNACFIFRQDDLPFRLRGEVAGNSAGLKHPNHVTRLLHMEGWERDFARELEGLGIRPGQSVEERPTRSRLAEERPRPATSPASPAPRVPFTKAALKEFVDRHNLTVTDKTGIGGSLFVGYTKPDGTIANQLKEWGFKYGPTKRAWYRKGWL